jgi:septal ring factor EnvC (AmiA/AmiB activator)
MDRGHRPVIALLAALGLAMVVPAAQQDPKRLEAERRQLNEQIQRLQRRVQEAAVEKDRRLRALRDADRSVSRAQNELTEVRAERAARNAVRRHLESERAARVEERRKTEADLGKQLRAAYFMGRNEPLKLLLNQQSPAEFSRNLAYYGYLGRLRADQMAELSENIRKIDELTAQIEAEEGRLAALEQAHAERLGGLEKARKSQSQVLASLEKETASRAAQLSQARKAREQLDRTLEELRRATRSSPYDPDAPFARTRSRLSWPVAGKVSVTYNETMSSGLKSDAIEIDTDRGAPVRAIHEGRVWISDWVPGRGYTVAIDHGDGYLSVYSHLDEIHAAGNTEVAGGDTIGIAGVSGGRKRPGLYFQIRRAAKDSDKNYTPIDPRPWFRTPAPPAN